MCILFSSLHHCVLTSSITIVSLVAQESLVALVTQVSTGNTGNTGNISRGITGSTSTVSLVSQVSLIRITGSVIHSSGIKCSTVIVVLVAWIFFHKHNYNTLKN